MVLLTVDMTRNTFIHLKLAVKCGTITDLMTLKVKINEKTLSVHYV